jgi:hypothetical protein
VKRSLTAVALASASLFALATPAFAAPPVHQVDSGCTDYGPYTYCYSIDVTIKTTETPSKNAIYHTTGTNEYNVTFDDGSAPQGRSYNFDFKSVTKQGQTEPVVNRFTASETYYVGSSTCTDVTTYKATNGIVQVQDFTHTCNF